MLEGWLTRSRWSEIADSGAGRGGVVRSMRAEPIYMRLHIYM
jgi:hypothetical protein